MQNRKFSDNTTTKKQNKRKQTNPKTKTKPFKLVSSHHFRWVVSSYSRLCDCVDWAAWGCVWSSKNPHESILGRHTARALLLPCMFPKWIEACQSARSGVRSSSWILSGVEGRVSELSLIELRQVHLYWNLQLGCFTARLSSHLEMCFFLSDPWLKWLTPTLCSLSLTVFKCNILEG